MQVRVGLVLALLAAGCGTRSGGNGASDGGNGRDALPIGPDAFAGPWTDFPGTPVTDTGAPAGAAGLFGAAGTGSGSAAGPCLVEPEVGTLFPQNWLRPRFSWIAGGSENLFELRVTTPNETNPLIVYTTASTWTMPADLWALLASHIVDQPITVTVRGATVDGTGTTLTSGPDLGSTGDIAIAPAQAPGAIVYWTTSGGTRLRGFHIGDESVTDIVTPADDTATNTQCIGCHSSTPDGTFVGFSASSDPGNGDPTAVGLLSADGLHTAPTFISAAAATLMARPYQEAPVFSTNHWRDGDHVSVAEFPVNSRSEMTWIDLEATSGDLGTGWGVIGRGTETTGAASASFAHTSDTLLYTASSDVASGVTTTHGDLETVPYNNRLGGTPTPVPGASGSAYNEYYPTWSPDDRFIAFNRVDDGQSSYNDAAAEVFVIPAAGGTPTRLAANTPPTCSNLASPGITNSWPKWAPDTTDVGTRRYYWLTFSSRRTATNNPQLYVTPVVVDGGVITTYPALYLWNQPVDESNHTPAWDNFDVPIQ